MCHSKRGRCSPRLPLPLLLVCLPSWVRGVGRQGNSHACRSAACDRWKGDDSDELDLVISLLNSLNEPYQKEDSRGMAGLYTIWIMVEFGDERPIYLLPVSIHGFTKVLEGFESRTLRKGYDCYLEFCECFPCQLAVPCISGFRPMIVGITLCRANHVGVAGSIWWLSRQPSQLADCWRVNQIHLFKYEACPSRHLHRA